MSKFGCTCGHTIRDQTDCLPYRGDLLKDQDWAAFFVGTREALTGFLAGVRSGDLSEWHRKWPWLKGWDDEDIVASLLDWHWGKYRIVVYECEQCGRLWVQTGTKSDFFVPFLREEASDVRVLPSEHHRADETNDDDE